MALTSEMNVQQEGSGVFNIPPELPSASETGSVREPEIPDAGTTPEPTPGTTSQPVPTDGAGNHPLRMLHARDWLLNEPAAEFLVDDLFLQNSQVWFVGASNTYKTFVALDLAASIATGQPEFLGHPIRMHGPVVYLIGEGKGRFKYRLLGWEQHHQRIAPAFYFKGGPLDMLDPKEVNQLLADLLVIKPVLVVVDTLSRNFGDGNENETQDMAQFIRHCDLLRQSGAAILVLHHLNATGARERGNTSGKGAIDTQVLFKVSVEGGRG
jgi:hypothetical protein